MSDERKLIKTIFIAFTLKESSVADFCIAVANYLSRNCKVVIFSHANENHGFLISESVTVLRWPSKRPTRLKDLLFLMKQIRIFKPQILIANFAAVNIFLLGGFLSGIKHRIAWYHTLTTQLEYSNLRRVRKALLYRMATKLVANSQAGKVDLMKSFYVSDNKIEVLNNAVRYPLYQSRVDQNKIVFAGRLHQVKGIEVLIRALSTVRKEFGKVKLIIIGEDEGSGEYKKLKILERELSLEGNINFTGNRSRNFVLEEFSSAYCTVVPSFFEAFGYVVIESFSVRTPVIGSNTTGISEIIRDNVDGFLFRPGDHDHLAEKIICLLKDRSLRNRMAENCHRRFIQNYELNKIAKQFATSLQNY